MAGCALVNGFNVSMRSIFGLDRFPNLHVAGEAENILSCLQWLVAAAALVFECGVRVKAFQRRFLAAVLCQLAGTESLAARKPGSQP